MKRTRHVLVMTLVATALCADRVATAAPDLRAQLQPAADPIARLANHLATKLSGKLRRVMPAMRLHEARHEGDPVPLCAVPPVCASVAVHIAEGSPFQFRLPPPAL